MCRTRRTTKRRVSKIKMSKSVACIILLLHCLVDYSVKLSKYISSTVLNQNTKEWLTKCFLHPNPNWLSDYIHSTRILSYSSIVSRDISQLH